MGWIITSLFKIFLGLINGMIAWTIQLVEHFQLDFGIGPSNIANAAAFDFVDPSEAVLYGLLDNTFPDARNFSYLFVTLAVTFVLIIMIVKLYQGMFAPMTETEGPMLVVSRSAIAIFGVFSSYTIFVLMERLFNSVYDQFYSKFTAISEGDKASLSGLSLIGGDDKSITGSDGFWGAIFGSKGNGVTILFIQLLLACTLTYAFVRLVFEIYERYVALGLMFYTCPLAFAMLASKETKSVFTSWMRMVLSQFVLMCLNLFFVGVFISALHGQFEAARTAGRTYVFSTDIEFVRTMLLYIGWMIVGQKVDEYMRSLGLSIANTGAGLGGAILASVGTSMMLVKTATRLAGKGVNVGRNAYNKHKQHSQNAISNQFESPKVSAENNLKESDIGGMTGEEFKNNIMSRADSPSGNLPNTVNKANIDYDKSAAMSGLGAQVVADGSGSVMHETALANSEASNYLNENNMMRAVSPDGSVETPLTSSQYNALTDNVKIMASSGRLPSESGIPGETDRTKYKDITDNGRGILHCVSEDGKARDVNVNDLYNIKGENPAPGNGQSSFRGLSEFHKNLQSNTAKSQSVFSQAAASTYESLKTSVTTPQIEVKRGSAVANQKIHTGKPKQLLK